MRRRSILTLGVSVPREVGALDRSPDGCAVLEAARLDELAGNAAGVLLKGHLARVGLLLDRMFLSGLLSALPVCWASASAELMVHVGMSE